MLPLVNDGAADLLDTECMWLRNLDVHVMIRLPDKMLASIVTSPAADMTRRMEQTSTLSEEQQI